MSVHNRGEGAKRRYEVRYREGTRNRSRTFTRRRDAEAFDAEVQRRRQLGPIAVQMLDAGAATLDDYVLRQWGPTHLPTLATATRRDYAGQYDRHLRPTFGGTPLRDITTSAIRQWQAERVRAGAGKVAIRHALDLLGTIMQSAVEADLIAVNPQRNVKKVQRPPKTEIQPLAPSTVEMMRTALLHGVARTEPAKKHARKTTKRQISQHPLRDATLVSLLAYAGLRPGEALALRWGDVRDTTLLIQRSASFGEVKATKTGSNRTVTLLDPLRRDLTEWRMASGRPADDVLVFPAEDGAVWSKAQYESWRRRAFASAAIVAGAKATPYTLRHSFASLLLYEGKSVIFVARQLGHDATLTLTTYGHVIGELENLPTRMTAEDAIRAARGGDVRSQFAEAH